MCIYLKEYLRSPLTPKGGTPTKCAKFVQKMNVFNIFRVGLPLWGQGG